MSLPPAAGWKTLVTVEQVANKNNARARLLVEQATRPDPKHAGKPGGVMPIYVLGSMMAEAAQARVRAGRRKTDRASSERDEVMAEMNASTMQLLK